MIFPTCKPVFWLFFIYFFWPTLPYLMAIRIFAAVGCYFHNNHCYIYDKINILDSCAYRALHFYIVIFACSCVIFTPEVFLVRVHLFCLVLNGLLSISSQNSWSKGGLLLSWVAGDLSISYLPQLKQRDLSPTIASPSVPSSLISSPSVHQVWSK